jgi:hypothetical protein
VFSFGHWSCKGIIFIIVIGVLLVVGLLDFVFVDCLATHLDSLKDMFFE